MINKQSIEFFFTQQWYMPKKTWFCWGLTPLAMLFSGIVKCRRALYQKEWLKPYRAPCPVIVIGNISVGGVGKTPLVVALYFFLTARGWTPGIVSRGYRGHYKNVKWVTPDSDPQEVGDEAVLLAARTGAAVVVARDRAQAIQTLVQETACDIILSDDGLQHYKMMRDIEIVVIDAEKKLGNECCLPAGPLREPPSRLKEADIVVTNGGEESECAFSLSGISLLKLSNPVITQSVKALHGKKIHAVAGIGSPKRFFDHLRGLGAEVIEYSYADHYSFQEKDFECFSGEDFVVMTEKDAVKCHKFAKENMWFFPVEAHLNALFIKRFQEGLNELVRRNK